MHLVQTIGGQSEIFPIISEFFILFRMKLENSKTQRQRTHLRIRPKTKPLKNLKSTVDKSPESPVSRLISELAAA